MSKRIVRLGAERAPGGRGRGVRRPAGRTAVLLDLENIARVGDGWVDECEFERRMCLLDPYLRSADYVAAACAGHVLRRYLPSFITRGLHVDLVPGTPDAADRILLDHADFLRRRGFDRAIVISGDHCFACLAEHFELTVVALPGTLSRTLARGAAHVVTLADRAPRPTRPPSTARPPARTSRTRPQCQPRSAGTTPRPPTPWGVTCP